MFRPCLFGCRYFDRKISNFPIRWSQVNCLLTNDYGLLDLLHVRWDFEERAVAQISHAAFALAWWSRRISAERKTVSYYKSHQQIALNGKIGQTSYFCVHSHGEAQSLCELVRIKRIEKIFSISLRL